MRTAVCTALCIAGALSAPWVTPALSADFTMKIGFATINDQNHEWAQMYEQAVEEASAARIDVEVYPASQLGPVPRQIEGVQFGTIEAVLFPADFFVGLDPRYGVFSIPSVFKDMENAAKTIADPELNEEILSLGEEFGLVGVTAFVYAPSDYFGLEPIRELEDFSGLKFRVNATPAERERMRILGSTAVPMPLTEVIPSLQNGAIDATQSAIAVFVNFKFDNLGSVITQTDDTMLVPIAVVSKAWLDTLPADLQTIVIEEGRKLQDHVQQRSFEVLEAMRVKWVEAGGEIIKLSAEDQTKLIEMLEPVGETVTASDPELNAFYQRVKAVSHNY